MKHTFSLVLLLLCLHSSFGQTKKKTLSELIDKNNSGWDLVSRWIKVSKNPVTILPRDSQKADSAIICTQLSTDDPLGGVIYNCGGLLIDSGWVRILGSGSTKMSRSVPQWNFGKAKINSGDIPSFVLIGDDVIGGLFAINAGGIDEINLGKIYYFGPNSLQWSSLGLNYSQFLVFCMSDALRDFYSDFKWKGWQNEVTGLDGNQVVSCYPLLWTKEGKEFKCNRKVVPIQKLWDTYALKHKELTRTIYRSFTFNQH